MISSESYDVWPKGGEQGLLDLRNDDVVPVGQGPLDSELEGLEHGELFLAGLVLVTLILKMCC